MSNPYGNKPKYTSKEQITGLIDAYFEECKGTPLTDDDGRPIFDKNGYPIIQNQHPPTITGLALALGFTNRMSLLNYQGRAEFRDVITRAKSRVEQYTEERLFDKDGSGGARFSLQNNFKGWREEATSENGGQKEVVIVELTRKAVPEAKATPSEGDDDKEVTGNEE